MVFRVTTGAVTTSWPTLDPARLIFAAVGSVGLTKGRLGPALDERSTRILENVAANLI